MRTDNRVETLRHFARRIGAGRALRHLYYAPVGRVRQSILAGGPIEQRRTEKGRREMVAAARSMRPLTAHSEDRGWRVHFLSGEKYWYQTVFCYSSLHWQSPVQITPVIHDDGTFSEGTVTRLKHLIPWLQFVSHQDITERLDKHISPKTYPTLREYRIRQPLLRKITDLHIGTSGWKILLDSDMLFFRNPQWLFDWLDGPKRPAYMVDCVESYGYSHELRSRVAGQNCFPDRANIGFFGWRSEELDVDWLEYAVNALVAEEGLHYNLTQGITSMMFAGHNCDIAPEDDYVVLPALDEGRNPNAVMHHYVAHSKRSYFQHGWRRAIERGAGNTPDAGSA